MGRTRLGSAITVCCLLIGGACRESFSGPQEEAFDPAEVAGLYSLNQVDGHAIGWYHDLGTVDCQAAFINGQLELAANGQFDLDLDFNIRCLGTDPFDGSGTINVYGSRMRKQGDLVLLTGLGPNFVDPQRIPLETWSLEVRPNDPWVTLRFVGVNREFWADPVIRMGPRQ